MVCDEGADSTPTLPGGAMPQMDVQDVSMELDALSEKIQRLSEQERALSRRMACRSQSGTASTTERGTLSWAQRSKANLQNLKVAKQRNQDLEDFCDHWMAWLRGGTLREGADAVAVCREQFFESVEAMLPAWGELTSRETQVAVSEAKVQLQVLRDRREEAVKHLKRSQELGKELRDIQVELQQQHLEIPSLYMAAMGNSWLPEFEGMPTTPAATPTAGSPSFSPWPACFPGAGMPWPWPPWTWQAAPQVPVQGDVEQQRCPTSDESTVKVESVEQPNVGQVPPKVSQAQASVSHKVKASKQAAGKSQQVQETDTRKTVEPDTVDRVEIKPTEPSKAEAQTPAADDEQTAATRAATPATHSQSSTSVQGTPPAPPIAVCQVLSPPQEILRQVKLLLSPVGKQPLQPSALRKLLRAPGSWSQALLKATTPEDLQGASQLELFAAALVLLKGHMSKNLAEASAASAAAEADALRTARSPGGHSMAWQELLSVLPQLRGVSPKADFEGLCKISAEQLLPRSGAAPVRRLGEALAQVGLPLRGHADRGSEGAKAGAQAEVVQESEDSEEPMETAVEKESNLRTQHFSESTSTFKLRPKMSGKMSMASRPSQKTGDLSVPWRQDPAWQLAQARKSQGVEEEESESEIADVDDL